MLFAGDESQQGEEEGAGSILDTGRSSGQVVDSDIWQSATGRERARMSRANTGVMDSQIMTTAQGRVGHFFNEAEEDDIEDEDRFSVHSAQGEHPHYSIVDVVDSGLTGSINESSRAPQIGHPVTFSGGSIMDSGPQVRDNSSLSAKHLGSSPCYG